MTKRYFERCGGFHDDTRYVVHGSDGTVTLILRDGTEVDDTIGRSLAGDLKYVEDGRWQEVFPNEEDHALAAFASEGNPHHD